MIDVFFHPEAVDEYEESYKWYFHRNQSIAESFRMEVEKAVELIQQHPQHWSKYDDIHRRFLLHRFPFSIIYRSDKDKGIWIMAIAHQKREKGYWLNRG